MNLPRIPLPDEPIRADWARQVVDCLRALRPSGGGRARVTQTPEGTTTFVGPEPRRPEPPPPAEPWDVKFSGTSAAFTQCDYVRGGLTVLIADLSYTLTGADGDIFIARKTNTEAGTVEIIEGTTKASVTDQAVPADKTFTKRLLYKVRKATLGDDVSITILTDYRRQPVEVLYI